MAKEDTFFLIFRYEGLANTEPVFGKHLGGGIRGVTVGDKKLEGVSGCESDEPVPD